jgi:pyridoxamine 5'-phosphate oxidase
MVPDHSLPETLPREPMLLVAAWLAEAVRRKDQPNPNAMVLASCDGEGHPSARVVLSKGIDVESGTIRFVTNYESRKARELAINPRAALVMHWDHLHRQIRIEGIVQKASAADSDEYFATRPRASQLGAWASAQSQPVASRDVLHRQYEGIEARFAGTQAVPRPANWGGYVLWADAVELWLQGSSRLHDRALWRRDLKQQPGEIRSAGDWSATRLQP